jgi:hypothetical protein
MCFDGDAPSAEKLMKAIGAAKDRADAREAKKRDKAIAVMNIPSHCPFCSSDQVAYFDDYVMWYHCLDCGLVWETKIKPDIK